MFLDLQKLRLELGYGVREYTHEWSFVEFICVVVIKRLVQTLNLYSVRAIVGRIVLIRINVPLPVLHCGTALIPKAIGPPTTCVAFALMKAMSQFYASLPTRDVRNLIDVARTLTTSYRCGHWFCLIICCNKANVTNTVTVLLVPAIHTQNSSVLGRIISTSGDGQIGNYIAAVVYIDCSFSAITDVALNYANKREVSRVRQLANKPP